MLVESEAEAVQHTDHWPMGLRGSECNKSKGNNLVNLFLVLQRMKTHPEAPY